MMTSETPSVPLQSLTDCFSLSNKKNLYGVRWDEKPIFLVTVYRWFAKLGEQSLADLL